MHLFFKFWQPSIQRKSLLAFIFTALFFALYLLYFRPGYLLIDDVSIISLASGYLGGKPVPFLLFSNVLLGFLLNLLYRLPGNLNWEICIFIGLNFLSVWALIYLVLIAREHPLYKVIVVLGILACDSYILLNITFTLIAVFSSIAGYCLVLSASLRQHAIKKKFLVFGSLLILISGLIRIEVLLLVPLTIGLAILVMFHSFSIKPLMLTLVVTGCLAVGCMIFEQIYIQYFPAWKSFYDYSDARGAIQDTPRSRISNIQDALKGAGWNHNDYQMFINWFFPDENLFSIAKLQYIIDHTSSRQQGIANAVYSYFFQNPDLKSVDVFPYFLVILSIWLAALFSPARRRVILPLLLLLLTYAVLVIFLLLTQKVPQRVSYSFFVTVSIFSLFVLQWSNANKDESQSLALKLSDPSLIRLLPSTLLILGAVIVVWNQAVVITQIHKQQQTEYVRILTDLELLQAQGEIAPNALIVSPAHGIPLEWSNPFVLNFPKIQYQEMGWLTFSPAYNEVLRQHNAIPLTTSLYQQDNVYLMVNTKWINDIKQFAKDHEGVKLKANSIFAFRDNRFVGNGYGDTVLSKLVQDQ
jgi:hypothetical protein